MKPSNRGGLNAETGSAGECGAHCHCGGDCGPLLRTLDNPHFYSPHGYFIFHHMYSQTSKYPVYVRLVYKSTARTIS